MPQLRVGQGDFGGKSHAKASTSRGTRDARWRSAPQGEKNSRPPRGIPLEAGPVGIMGKMPMPRQARTESFSFSSLRPCVFALPFSSLFPPPPRRGIRPRLRPYWER